MLLVSPVGSVLTDPGLLCAGRRVVLNCTGGQHHTWMYDVAVVTINNITPPPAEPVELSDVLFTFSQLSPSPNLTTQISFVSSLEMGGKILACLSEISICEVTLSIESSSKFSNYNLLQCI